VLAVLCCRITDDPELKEWVKLPGPFLPQPAAALQLTGWRDPFILERPCGSSPCWYVMVGAGVKGKCGTALVYRNRDLKSGEWGVWCVPGACLQFVIACRRVTLSI
jgi:hypothetical protein